MKLFVNEFAFPQDAVFRDILSADVAGAGIRVVGTLGQNGLLAAINGNGGAQWIKTYILGGAGLQLYTGVRCDNGDLMLHGSIPVSADRNETLIVRVGADGEVIWARSYTRDKTRFNIRLVKGRGENYFFAEWYNEAGSTDDIDVVKIDGNGNVLAAAHLHSPSDDQVYTLAPFNDGCVLVGGTARNVFDCFVAVLDGSLRPVWLKVFGGDTSFDEIKDIVQTGAREFVITGETNRDRAHSYMARFSIGDASVNATVYSFTPGLEFGTKRLLPRGTGFYLAATAEGDPRTSFVAFMNRKFEVLWERTLTLPANLTLLDLSDAGDEQGLVLGGYSTGGGRPIRAVLAHTDRNLKSCGTAQLDPQRIGEVRWRVIDWNVRVTQVKPTVTVRDVQTRPITPTVTELCPTGISVDLENARIQSPYMQLHVAGSDANDDTPRGFHTRWEFLRSLGRHLPKGNLAAPGGPYATTIGFNRADDFVRLYRAEMTTDYGVDLSFTTPPTTIFENGRVREWLYADLPPFSTDISLRFYDTLQYDQIRQSRDPRTHPARFLAAYTGIVEARAVGKLAFFVDIHFQAIAPVTPQYSRIEALTLPDPLDNTSRRVSCRRSFPGGGNAPVTCDNIELVLFDYFGIEPTRMHIATYEDFLAGANRDGIWRTVGNYSLDDGNADADASVFRQLEDPPKFTIDNRWPKYRRSSVPGLLRVKTQNYRDRWLLPNDGLKQGVITYLNASRTDVAAEVVVPNSDFVANISATKVSYLDLLNFVAIDYHAARMLGMGMIDANATVDPEARFVYLMQYVTEGQLEREQPRKVTHYWMSTPVRLIDRKFPPAPQISLTYGLPPEECEGTTTALTDAAGYSFADAVRFINLHRVPFTYEFPPEPFFGSQREFCLCDESVPVGFAVHYGPGPIGSTNDVVPELSHDPDWLDHASRPEVALIPDRGRNPIYTHAERSQGVHHYSARSINIWSRIGTMSPQVQTDDTQFARRNTMLPPASLAAQVIQKETPLLLTTPAEQARLAALPAGDKTLVRLTFDWNYIQNQAYQRADTIELYFRTEPRITLRGRIVSVTENPAQRTATITTGPYTITSTSPATTVQPEIAGAKGFTGARLVIAGDSWLIESVSALGPNPTLVVKQLRTTASIDANQDNNFCTVEMWRSPQAGDRFTIVENIDDPMVWNQKLAKEVALVHFTPHHTETVMHNDGKSRTFDIGGFTAFADIQSIDDPDPNVLARVPPNGPASVPSGMYTVTFPNTQLPSTGDPDVEFHEGVIRMFTTAAGTIRVLRVWSAVQKNADLVLTVYDSEFGLKRGTDGKYLLDNFSQFIPVDGYVPVQTGVLTVNYHPSYCVYLTVDPAAGFEEASILPARDEGSRQTFMSARARDGSVTPQLTSPMAVPAVLVARELRDPVPPAQPLGPIYANRPDFFGKGSFTFDVEVGDPQSLIFYKANERKVLDQLYEPQTVRDILAALGSQSAFDREFETQRWSDLVNGVTAADGQFIAHVAGGFRFPIPNNAAYTIPDPKLDPPVAPFQNNTTRPGSSAIVPGTMRTMKSVVAEAIEKAFVPLTRVPMVYRKLTDITLQTSNRPPKGTDLWPMAVRFEKNAAGNVLKATDAGYGDPGNTHWVRFTDYTLDGAAENIYFYFAVELSNTLQVSGRSGVAGPVMLVNSSPPVAPAIRDLRVRTANLILGERAAVIFSINPYLPSDHVVRVQIYRGTNAADAASVRTMTLAKTIPVGEELLDDFADLDVPPFGDPLYYRLVALRRFRNEDGQEELAPSYPSELRQVTVIDDAVPPAPQLGYTYQAAVSGNVVELQNVKLLWNRTAWNARYHVFKMNPRGNWVKVATLPTNDAQVALDLAATDLGTNVLTKRNADGKTLYHRFKVVTENGSGLLSREEKPLVI